VFKCKRERITQMQSESRKSRSSLFSSLSARMRGPSQSDIDLLQETRRSKVK